MPTRIFPFIRSSGAMIIDGIQFISASSALCATHKEYLGPFHADNHGNPVTDAMTCTVADDDREIDRVERAETALRFALLRSPSMFLEHTIGYWIYPGTGSSSTWLVRTRAGGIAGPADRLQITPPWPLRQETVHLGNLDHRYLPALAECGCPQSSPAERRLYRAVQLFARSRGLALTWEEQVVLLAMASEAFLNVSDQDVHRDFVERFRTLFGSWAVRHWADAFYDLRSQIVHGEIVTDGDHRHHSRAPFATRDPSKAVARKVAAKQPVDYHETVARKVVESGIYLTLDSMVAARSTLDDRVVRTIFLRQAIQAVTSPEAVMRRILRIQPKHLVSPSKDVLNALAFAVESLPDAPPDWLDRGTVTSWIQSVDSVLSHRASRNAGEGWCYQTLNEIGCRLQQWQALQS